MKFKTKLLGALSYHDRTLTKITCSAEKPTFLINGIYNAQHYNQLPVLFGIEATVADDRSNVTLLINGSIMAHNVTVECQNFVDLVGGIKETLFRFTLLFNGKHYNYTDYPFCANNNTILVYVALIH